MSLSSEKNATVRFLCNFLFNGNSTKTKVKGLWTFTLNAQISLLAFIVLSLSHPYTHLNACDTIHTQVVRERIPCFQMRPMAFSHTGHRPIASKRENKLFKAHLTSCVFDEGFYWYSPLTSMAPQPLPLPPKATDSQQQVHIRSLSVVGGTISSSLSLSMTPSP